MIKHLLMVLFLFTQAEAAFNEGDRQTLFPKNLLTNPGAENGGSAGWTNTGPLQSATSSLANIDLPGRFSFLWDSTSAGQIMASTPVTVTSGSGLSSQPVVASCRFKTETGTATHLLQLYDGTNVIAQRTIISTTTGFTRTTVNSVSSASGSLSLRIVSVASNEPAIYIDNCYLGLSEGFSLSNISQATLYATATQAGASGCVYSENTSSGENNFIDLGNGSGCNAWTTTGPITPVGTNSSQMTLSNLPAGQYDVVVTGSFNISTAAVANFRITDGTNNGQTNYMYHASGAIGYNQIKATINYTSAQASVTLKIQASDNGAVTAAVNNDVVGRNMSWVITRFPTQSEQAARLETLTWIVDANISGANPSLGIAAVSSYTGIENGSLTLTNNSVPNGIAAQIPCSSTNAPTGTTCSVGNESVGVSFNVPASGLVEACAQFAWYGDPTPTGGNSITAAFQLVETPNNAQTILQEGKSRIASIVRAGGTSFSAVVSYPQYICGTFILQAGQRTLRLMYEQDVTGTVSASHVLADADPATGQRDIHWTVKPLTYGAGTAVGLLTGLVTSENGGGDRVARVAFGGTTVDTDVCSSNPCTIWRQNGAVSSVTRTSAGDYSINFIAGYYSAPPQCSYSYRRPGATNNTVVNLSSVTSSLVRYEIFAVGGGTADGLMNVICVGPR